MSNLKKDAEKVLTNTQGERTGPFGAYVPDEFQAFELGAQHALNYVMGLVTEDPGITAGMLIAKIESYRSGITPPIENKENLDSLKGYIIDTSGFFNGGSFDGKEPLL